MKLNPRHEKETKMLQQISISADDVLINGRDRFLFSYNANSLF